MIVLHLLPLVASLGPLAVGVAKRRPWNAVVGLVVFDIGYVGILLAENDGANSGWHLVWLLGLGLLPWGVVPRPEAGSWWADRFGEGTVTTRIWAAAPVSAFVLIFVYLGFTPLLQWVFPFVVLPLPAVAVLGPVFGWIVGRVTRSATWRSYAVMGGASGLVLASVIVAYVADAFFFGF